MGEVSKPAHYILDKKTRACMVDRARDMGKGDSGQCEYLARPLNRPGDTIDGQPRTLAVTFSARILARP
ncbi:MAG: hypothetical protein CME59_01785 [Halioglobus sp.]|nr:hypothetical protein [Halioglobus sp.]